MSNEDWSLRLRSRKKKLKVKMVDKGKYQLLEDAFTLDSEDEDEIVHLNDVEDQDLVTDDGATVRLITTGPNGNAFHHESQESFCSITLEIMFPFIIAGLGMVGAGIVLDIVQHWPVFETINELFILVPALLGLKGNLEMTLASRLSTQVRKFLLKQKIYKFCKRIKKWSKFVDILTKQCRYHFSLTILLLQQIKILVLKKGRKNS